MCFVCAFWYVGLFDRNADICASLFLWILIWGKLFSVFLLLVFRRCKAYDYLNDSVVKPHFYFEVA